MTNLISNQKGFSIVEGIAALALITVVGFSFISGVLSLKKISADTGTKNSLYKQINDVIENIRPNVRMYQINFISTDDEREKALDIKKLPMAWGNGFVSTAKQCENCPGRFGFVIQAYPGMKGLYLVTLRMTHKDWAEEQKEGDYGFMDYQFVVNSQ